MKPIIALVLCGALLLAGCGKKPAASTSASDPQSAATSAASSAVSSQSTASSSAASSAANSAPVKATKQQAVTLHMANEDKLALISLNTPDTWSYDGATTFSQNDKKIAEVAAIFKVQDAANPLSADLVYGFGASDEMSYPDGLGHIETLDKLVSDNICRTYYYKMWPDDAEKPWYPHYTFYVVDGYVVQIYFFSDSQTGDDALFDEVLSSISIHFAS